MTKKLISTFTSIALLAGVAAMPVAAEETYALGDMNTDGKVDCMDAAGVLDYYNREIVCEMESNWAGEQIVLGDVDFNGSTDIFDCMSILRYYVYTMIVDTPVSSDDFFADDSIYEGIREEAEEYETPTIGNGVIVDVVG